MHDIGRQTSIVCPAMTVAMRLSLRLVSVTASGPESDTGERDETALAESAAFSEVAELLLRLRVRIYGASDLVAPVVEASGDADDRLGVLRFLGPGAVVRVRHQGRVFPGGEDDVSDHVRI